jgi:hypothetical protein
MLTEGDLFHLGLIATGFSYTKNSEIYGEEEPRGDGTFGSGLQSDTGHENRWDQATDRRDRGLRHTRILSQDRLL